MFISKGNVNIRRVYEWTSTDQNDTVEPLLEPCHRVVLVNTMWGTNSGTSLLSPRNSNSWPPHNHVEIHTKDTDTGVVPGAEIDVLLDAETEITRLREILSSQSQLVLLHLETTLKDFLCFWPTDGDVCGNFLVSSNTELTDGVTRLGRNWCLTRQLLQDL